MAFAAVLASVSCREGPSPEERARLLDEARAEDKKLRSRDASLTEPWTLEIRTDTPGVRRVITAEELAARAKDEMTTVGPSPGAKYEAPNRYRGVRLSRLVEGIDAGADRDVTLLGDDGYFTTIKWDDVLRFPVLVAVERDGKPIPRSDGGPVLVALPLSLDGDLAARYGSDGFCFYVSGIAIGRPPPRIDVDGKVREASDLVQVGMTHRRQEVRFRRGWPSQPVELDGPRLANVVGPTKQPLRISFFARPARDAITITPEELAACDPLLVIGPSPTTAPLSTRVGGPVLLAPLPSCQAPWALRQWPAFVDGIEVLR